jgi:hypothetical protein
VSLFISSSIFLLVIDLFKLLQKQCRKYD